MSFDSFISSCYELIMSALVIHTKITRMAVAVNIAVCSALKLLIASFEFVFGNRAFG